MQQLVDRDDAVLLEHFSVFHHELHVADGVDVLKRVALHGDDLTASGLATALYLAFFASVLALGGYGTLAVRAD